MHAFLVDSHCHLNYEQLYLKLNAVINNASDCNVKILQSICTEMNEIDTLKTISKQYSNVYYSVGVHPLNVDKSVVSVDTLLSYINDEKISCFGETGLDFYKFDNCKNKQIESFENHIIASQISNLPLVIHTRNAEQSTYEMLYTMMKEKPFYGVVHCFTGSYDFAMQCIELNNLYISASGIITFNKCNDIRNVFYNIPMNRILIETDAPFLAPIPYRGKNNEPAYVVEVAKSIAKIKNISYEEVVHYTTENYLKLFKIKL